LNDLFEYFGVGLLALFIGLLLKKIFDSANNNEEEAAKRKRKIPVEPAETPF
jgi:hypothetical protein